MSDSNTMKDARELTVDVDHEQRDFEYGTAIPAMHIMTSMDIARLLDNGDRWVAAHIEEARLRRSPYASLSTLHPHKAAALLDRNRDNRTINRPAVKRLVRAMESGDYELNGDTIKVSIDGALNDGQHRCQAVVESGVAIDTFIVWGLPRNSRYTNDAGQKRQTHQLMAMHGVKSASTIAKASSMLMTWDLNGTIDRSQSFTNIEKHKFYMDNQREIDSAHAAMSGMHSPAIDLCGTLSWPIFCLIVLRRKDVFAADEFMRILITGEGATGVINVARQKIIRERGHANRVRLTYREENFVRPVFQAWNAMRTDKDLKMLRDTDAFPVPV